MAWSFFVWGLSEEYWDFVRWMERRTPGGRGYRLGQGLRRGIQLWLREVDGKADARRERISAWAGTPSGDTAMAP
ncbi:hypothetical protein DW894_14625 [Ruminococcus sp. AM41-10BH]|nr:hypothetical protein DW894_14625 [Ruminococcus sp. AM41-10BH]